jgi:hypothetical protein
MLWEKVPEFDHLNSTGKIGGFLGFLRIFEDF